MGYEIRPLATLGTQARQFFTQAIGGAIVRLWANTFTVVGKVLALLDFEHEMRRKFLADQQFASTAAREWLIRHGYELGLTLDAGGNSVGTITVSTTPGTAVATGTPFVRADGATYSTITDVLATGTSVALPVQADIAGQAFDMEVGDTLTLGTGSAPIGLGTTGTVNAQFDGTGLSGGTDPEDIETFRARVLYRKRNPPQGGSAPDYVEWVGEALSTVRNVYVDSFANDERAVWACFTVTDQPDGIPSAGQVAIVQAYINDPIRRPITARAFAVAPTPVNTPIKIANLLPATDDVRAAIEAEIAALSIDEIQPARPAQAFTLYREMIEAAIARADGVKRFTLMTPASDIVFSTGAQMPVFDTITYV